MLEEITRGENIVISSNTETGGDMEKPVNKDSNNPKVN
jgi:hypothetical protein